MKREPIVLVAVILGGIAAACGPGGSEGEHGAARRSGGDEERVEIAHRASDRFRKLGLPFSEAVQVGDLLFLSGQIGTRPGTVELVPGGIGPETRQTLENLRRVLEANGSSLDRVVKCTVMLADISEWPAMNEVYLTFFPIDRLPARSAFGTAGLALGARVEIECIATRSP